MHPTALILILTLILLYFLPNVSTAANTTNLWLHRSIKNRRPRPEGCWRRSWICNQDESNWHGGGGGGPRVRRRCCQNQCVDVMSDVNNCGRCRRRCRFTWQCCRGFCVDVNRNPFNCGRCGNRCRWPSRCRFGMCGYADPQPPKHGGDCPGKWGRAHHCHHPPPKHGSDCPGKGGGGHHCHHPPPLG